jgi:O-acetylserine/cysteine efflux transporter
MAQAWQACTVTPRHTLLALLVVVLWGLNFLAIDFGLADVPPLVFLALRFILVAIPAVFFVKPPRIGWRNVLLIGSFLSFGQFALLYLSLALGMPPGLASLLLQVQVVLSVIVSAVVLRERPNRHQAIGIAVGMAGLAIVLIGHSYVAPWLPVVILLLAALSWAIGNALSRRARVASGLSLVVWSGLIVPIPSLALAMIVDSPAVVVHAITHLSLVAILSTVYTAVAASLIGYGIWNTLLAKYPTSAVVPFTLLVPIVGILVAWIVVNEQPSLTEIVGGTVMLAGLAIAVIVRAPWRIQDARPESAALVGFETLGTEILNPELATDDSA